MGENERKVDVNAVKVVSNGIIIKVSPFLFLLSLSRLFLLSHVCSRPLPIILFPPIVYIHVNKYVSIQTHNSRYLNIPKLG